MARRPIRVLLLIHDPDFARLLRDYLGARGYELIEPAELSDARALVATAGVDIVLAEAEVLARSALPRSLPTLCLTGMGVTFPADAVTRVLAKPASLKAVERALSELSAA